MKLSHATGMRRIQVANADVRKLEKFLENNRTLQEILRRLPQLKLTGCYVAAGSIAQTVWNALHGFEPTHGIKDYDIIYYDRSDTSRRFERMASRRAERIFADLKVPIEVVNEANVHLWFEKEFGDPMPRPYTSTEDAIGTFSTAAVCIGVRYIGGRLDVCAPYGLYDLFNLLLRRNGNFYTEERHREKLDRWTALWPKLKLVSA